MLRIRDLNSDVMTAVRSAGLEREGPPRCLTSRGIAAKVRIGVFDTGYWNLLGVVDEFVRTGRLKQAIKGQGSENPEMVYYDPGMEEMLVAVGVLSRESRVLETRPDPAAEGYLATIWFTEEELDQQRLAAARAAAAAARTNRSAGKTVGRSKR